jgi:hypothetical protein
LCGLTPHALCRIFQLFNKLLSKLKVSFDAIKKLFTTLSLAARSALNLYECAVSANDANLTL